MPTKISRANSSGGLRGVFDPLLDASRLFAGGCVDVGGFGVIRGGVDLAEAAEQARCGAGLDASDRDGPVARARFVLDCSSKLLVLGRSSLRDLVIGYASPNLLMLGYTSPKLLMLGYTSQGLNDEGEDEPDGEGADDDEDQASEDLYPERVIPAHEEDAEGDAAQKRQCRADVIADKSIKLGHGPLLSPPRPHER